VISNALSAAIIVSTLNPTGNLLRPSAIPIVLIGSPFVSRQEISLRNRQRGEADNHQPQKLRTPIFHEHHVEDRPSGKALTENKGLIAALKALRHPKATFSDKLLSPGRP
jgi:hypothetical protein